MKIVRLERHDSSAEFYPEFERRVLEGAEAPGFDITVATCELRNRWQQNPVECGYFLAFADAPIDRCVIAHACAWVLSGIGLGRPHILIVQAECDVPGEFPAFVHLLVTELEKWAMDVNARCAQVGLNCRIGEIIWDGIDAARVAQSRYPLTPYILFIQNIANPESSELYN